MSKNSKIHVGYIFSILIAIIIILITVKFGNAPQLVNQISFALTITSLVLAILAIGYAVYSNSSFSQNISKLDSASTLIKKSSKSLANITEDLKTKFDNVPSLLETLDKKADFTQELLASINDKTTNTESTFIKSDDIDKHLIEKIVTSTSNNGIYICYALKLAKDFKVIIDLKDFTDKTGIDLRYIVGFLQPLSSLGLIKREYIRTNTYEILGIHDEIEKNIIDAVENLWVKGQNDDFLEFTLDRINKIRNYFGLNSLDYKDNFS